MYTIYDLYKKLENLPQSQLKKDISLIKTDLTQIKLKDELSMPCLENIICEYDKTFYPKITAGIITLNEERCIKRCINSLINEVDEIIVIDGGSKDNTLNIIKKMIPFENVYKYLWRNDFSLQRNYIFEKANCNWILFIDSDEYLQNQNSSEFSLKSALRVLEYLSKDFLEHCFTLDIRNSDGNIDYDMKRIVNKKSDFRFYGKVHEELLRVDSNMKSTQSISINMIIEHDGYDIDVIKIKNKQKRNLKLLKEMIQIEPENKKWLFLYARDMSINHQNLLHSDQPALEEIYEIINHLEMYLRDQESDIFVNSNYNAYALFIICNQYLKLNDIAGFQKWFTVFKTSFPHCSDIGYLELLYFNIVYNYRIENNILKIEKEYMSKESYSVVNSTKDHLQFLLLLTADNSNNFEAIEKIFLRLPQESILKKQAENYLISKIDKIKNVLSSI
ncbi:glycosyltransferase [Paenibacillus sp. WLX2291]|uniref:glycosyltransferase n=1 Tax=Paenibacillus sp. WLX2291 TaxID=3296934 RepID=UPI00398454B2